MGDNQDPNSPDYRPNSNGGRDVGDVGSGKDFGADVYRLYLAGRVRIPETANLYAENANALYAVGPNAAAINSNHFLFYNVTVALGKMHEALYRTSQSLHQTAEALVEIADDYVRTDEAARDEFLEYLKDDRFTGKNENSVAPLSGKNLPENYQKPVEPGSFGEQSGVPKPGMSDFE